MQQVRTPPHGSIKFLIAFLALAAVALVWCAPAAPTAPVYGYEIVHVYPHDRKAFTQGLIYLNGFLYEGTGMNGTSWVRKVKLETGEVVQQIAIAQQYFGEGLTDWKSHLVELTWKNEVGFVYDQFSFHKLREFHYQGEGWGLTHDSKSLIESDGSAFLRFWDPETFQEQRRLLVKDGGLPVENLNELEWIKGEVYANIWQAPRIARISPTTGRVIAWINCEGLLSGSDLDGADVLNGIAYDSEHDRLFITGKLWPKLFEIRVKTSGRK